MDHNNWKGIMIPQTGTMDVQWTKLFQHIFASKFSSFSQESSLTPKIYSSFTLLFRMESVLSINLIFFPRISIMLNFGGRPPDVHWTRILKLNVLFLKRVRDNRKYDTKLFLTKYHHPMLCSWKTICFKKVCWMNMPQSLKWIWDFSPTGMIW